MPADSTHAIWTDPLAYDFRRNGPPYLPETDGVRTASLSGGDMSHESFFSELVAAFNVPMAELGAVVSLLRAASIVHQSHHWQTRGGNFYGDHLLFDRIYNESLPLIDSVAERAVGSGSRDLVCPKTQTRLAADLTEIWCDSAEEPTSFDMVAISFKVEQCVVSCLKTAREALEAKGQLSDGTDNLLQGVSDKHEEFLYLLQQRVGGRVASYTYKRADNVRDRSTRFVEDAYDAAKAIASGKIDVAVTPALKRLAQQYFKFSGLANKSQMEKIAESMGDQLDTDHRDAKRAVKMLAYWEELFREVQGIYHNLVLDE